MNESVTTPQPAEDAAEKRTRIAKTRAEIKRQREERITKLRTVMLTHPQLKQSALMRLLGYDSQATFHRDRDVIKREAKAQQVAKDRLNLAGPPPTLSSEQRQELLKRIEEKGSEYGSDEIMRDFFPDADPKSPTS